MFSSLIIQINIKELSVYPYDFFFFPGSQLVLIIEIDDLYGPFQPQTSSF